MYVLSFNYIVIKEAPHTMSADKVPSKTPNKN